MVNCIRFWLLVYLIPCLIPNLGTLPTCFGFLSSLTYLELDRNVLTGNLALMIEWNEKIYPLYLGTIPSTLWVLTKLSLLYLNQNSLSGTFVFRCANYCNLI